MKARGIVIAGSLLAASWAGATPISNSVQAYQAKIDEAQHDVDRDRATLQRDAAAAFRSDATPWHEAEARYETALGAGRDASAEKAAVETIESHALSEDGREKVDGDRDSLAAAEARLADAKRLMRENTRGTNQHDDSSQAVQPENRTQNGANFSIRSQRDSENHPPLPSSN